MAEPIELTIAGDEVDEAFWRSFESRRDVATLVIWGGALTNQQLEPLGRFPWLTGLVLGEMPIDDGVLPHLQPLRDLSYLNLAYTAVSGDLSPLRGAPLRDVRFEGCRRFGDAGARSLVQFPTLRQAELHMTGLTDDGLAALAPLPLEVLWLGPRVTDRGMQTVAGFSGLKHLDICTHLLTDEGVRAIAGLRALEVLWLSRSRITDASVEIITQFPALRELAVGHTEISPQGLETVRRALPGCRIVEAE